MSLRENNWVIVTDLFRNDSGQDQEDHASDATHDSLEPFMSFRKILRHAKIMVGGHDRIRLIASGASSPDQWRWALAEIPGENLLIQPPQWGNAAALLLTILEIRKKDPRATVTLLPAHYEVDDEEILLKAIDKSIHFASQGGQHGILLGMQPNPWENYEGGWILPYSLQDRSPYSLLILKDQVPPSLAVKLIRRGALWNSSVLTAKIDTLLLFYMMADPRLVWPMLRTFEANRFSSASEGPYQFVPEKDFIRDILFPNPQLVRTLPVETCGWSLKKAFCRDNAPFLRGDREKRSSWAGFYREDH